MTWVTNQSVVLQALLGGLFTWFCTIMGSAVVFFFKTVSRRLLDTMLGFAAGVMIAASFWSLLAPSIEYAESSYGNLAWIPAAVGFAAGGIFLRLVDAWVIWEMIKIRQKVVVRRIEKIYPKQPCSS